MLTMLAALPRDLGCLGGGVIYIDTEGAFSSERYAGYHEGKKLLTLQH